MACKILIQGTIWSPISPSKQRPSPNLRHIENCLVQILEGNNERQYFELLYIVGSNGDDKIDEQSTSLTIPQFQYKFMVIRQVTAVNPESLLQTMPCTCSTKIKCACLKLFRFMPSLFLLAICYFSRYHGQCDCKV